MNIPQRLGKYPISRVLGKGAMGIVYLGLDPVIKRPVAIKTIRKELIEDDERAESLSERFRREAQAAGALTRSIGRMRTSLVKAMKMLES